MNRDTNLGINFAVLNGRGGEGLTVLGNGLDIQVNAGFTPYRVFDRFTGKINGIVGAGFLAGNIYFKDIFINRTTAGFIKALEQVGEVNVLASPRVFVLNKQRAEIQLGQRLGYFTATQNLTSTAQTVQFLNTGTLLRLRPFVSNDRMIRLEVHPEKSTGTVDNNVPKSNTSEVATNVMVPDGATVVIGGLIENSDSSFQQGTIGLSRLPVAGSLFRAKTQSSTKRELIVLLTPRIWNPAGLQGAGTPIGPNCPPPMIGLAATGEPGRVAAAGARPKPAATTRPTTDRRPNVRPPAAPTGGSPPRVPTGFHPRRPPRHRQHRSARPGLLLPPAGRSRTWSTATRPYAVRR